MGKPPQEVPPARVKEGVPSTDVTVTPPGTQGRQGKLSVCCRGLGGLILQGQSQSMEVLVLAPPLIWVTLGKLSSLGLSFPTYKMERMSLSIIEGVTYSTNARHQIPTEPQPSFPDFSLGVGLCCTRETIKHPRFLTAGWAEGFPQPGIQ